MEKSFPELGLKAEDCTETSWINSTLYFANYRNGESIDVLKNRTLQPKNIYKNKSDFVKEAISEVELEEMWKVLLEGEIIPLLIWESIRRKNEQDTGIRTPFPTELETCTTFNMDLDLGINEEGSNTSYSKASVWGRKYFKNNFKRLALVKSKVDPESSTGIPYS
ncbi:hypothetical protein HHK36_032115 [Tetracentron sinense]|uniref:Berberine/berberine-like domain-containing protein n=1 Tax=Tetracentron sinense TaxID=13715 RepID=A0A835CXY4_TETSI|nr:hypothetical protein HHK36_032115 [Tetracentron sinense]